MQIRLATTEDAGAIADIYEPFVTNTAISFEMVPPDAGDMAARIAATIPRFPWLVATDDGTVVGYAYAGSYRARAAYAWSVEVSVYLAEIARQRGIAGKLYATLFDLLSQQGFRTALAGIALPNPASVGFHEKMGFTLLGVHHEVGWKFDQWHDVGWWRRGLGDGSPPAPTKSLEELDTWPNIV
jgi:phosphinothricin acetyltransferase